MTITNVTKRFKRTAKGFKIKRMAEDAKDLKVEYQDKRLRVKLEPVLKLDGELKSDERIVIKYTSMDGSRPKVGFRLKRIIF